jgi:hypothetical protein
MGAKNKSRTTGYDVHNALGAHVEASLKAYACVERAIELRSAGKSTAADKAQREAKRWLRKALAIEGALPPRPQGGRRSPE